MSIIRDIKAGNAAARKALDSAECHSVTAAAARKQAKSIFLAVQVYVERPELVLIAPMLYATSSSPDAPSTRPIQTVFCAEVSLGRHSYAAVEARLKLRVSAWLAMEKVEKLRNFKYWYRCSPAQAISAAAFAVNGVRASMISGTFAVPE